MALLIPLADSLVQPVISSVAKAISERGVRRAERRYIDKKLLISRLLIISIKNLD